MATDEQLAKLLIRDMALGEPAPLNVSENDEVFRALKYSVDSLIREHELVFNGIVERAPIREYDDFQTVANELFEAKADENGEADLKITWGRVISLFAYAVRLAQECHDETEKVEQISDYLAFYLSNNVSPIVNLHGGWEGLVTQYPAPDSRFKKAVLWSGLAVGLVATMFVSNLLR